MALYATLYFPSPSSTRPRSIEFYRFRQKFFCCSTQFVEQFRASHNSDRQIQGNVDPQPNFALILSSLMHQKTLLLQFQTSGDLRIPPSPRFSFMPKPILGVQKCTLFMLEGGFLCGSTYIVCSRSLFSQASLSHVNPSAF